MGVFCFVALASCDSPPPPGAVGKDGGSLKTDLTQIVKLLGDVTYTLEDGEVLHRENPDRFWIPSKERRENLVKDDLVKLVFNLTDGKQTQGERMWVTPRGGDRSGYTGILDNDPCSTDKIKSGLEVSFEPRHVIDIFTDDITDSEEAKQAGTEQPDTRPHTESGSVDKTQPEAEGRER